MMTVPVIDAADSITEMTLDGAQFGIHLSWNSTAEYWSISLQDAGGNPLIDGYALVPDTILFERLKTPSFPTGDFIAVTPDGRNTIAYDDLVGSGPVALIYLELTDFQAAAAGTLLTSIGTLT